MAKRISSTAINWAGIIEKFQAEDKAKITALKGLVDKYLREIASKPAELPKIDWNYYKSRISAPGMVDSFQKAYESLNVPYPSDQGLISATEKKNESKIKEADAKFAEMRKEIEKLTKELAEKEKIMPFSQMTLEEFLLARPEQRQDFDRPKMWPHHLIEASEKKND